jgi:hypothetical protein
MALARPMAGKADCDTPAVLDYVRSFAANQPRSWTNPERFLETTFDYQKR